MTEYITNFAKVLPSGDVIETYRITCRSNQLNPGKIAYIINKNTDDLVASSLNRDYNELKAGVYVASLSSQLDRDTIESKIKNILVNSGFLYDIDDLELEQYNMNSMAYVVANLLNNTVDKKIPQEIRCPHRPGERLSICLDIETLEKEYWSKGIANIDELFKIFCNDYPELCRNTDNDCSKFFKVVKCITMRFQHIVSEDENNEIYLILHQYYRRIGNLHLKQVLEYMKYKNIDLNRILGVHVNYRKDKNNTMVCRIFSFTENNLVLETIDGKYYQIDLDNLDNTYVAINPNYRSSRQFIYSYLCKNFEKHKNLNRLYPSKYFATLENDLEIIRRIVGRICIGGTCFSINKELKRIWWTD